MAGGGTGNVPWDMLTVPEPRFRAEATEPLGAEPVQADHPAHDVDDGVDRAHLVEVDVSRAGAVDGGLGLGQPAEELLWRGP